MAGVAVWLGLLLAVACGVAIVDNDVAFGLGGGRVVEMVSPPFKGGYGATAIVAVGPRGDRVAWKSLGAFSGAPSSFVNNSYVSVRGGGGWSTSSSLPPASLTPAGSIENYSTDLQRGLFSAELGLNGGEAVLVGTLKEFFVHDLESPDDEANWSMVGVPVETVDKEPFFLRGSDASADLSHIVFGAEPLVMPALLLSAEGTPGELYDMTTQLLGGVPSLKVVAVKNSSGSGEPPLIDPYCRVALGSASGKESRFNAIANDGETIFFTANPKIPSFHHETECDATYPTTFPANPAILFARIGGERTLQISESLPSGCAISAPCHSAVPARAEFQGASEDGATAFFTTTQPLVTEDVDSGNDLYMARLGCGATATECEPSHEQVNSLTRVSVDPHAGQPAGVQNVLSVAPDGSRVYFVATGDLLEPAERAALEAAGQAVPTVGADNLYVYERATESAAWHIAFIADLCSGNEHSGAVEDASCPVDASADDSELWANIFPEAQTAGPAGETLAFTSYGRLTSDDTDSAKDVFVYDARTGNLAHVSTGEGGRDNNGNDDAYNATIDYIRTTGNTFELARMGRRAISEDGTRIVFTYSGPLAEAAVNGLSNAYEWHGNPSVAGGGEVSLISTGNSTEPVNEVTIAPGGQDVFFITSQSLLAKDTDAAPDVYDARIKGGFPEAEAERELCAGDGCQGPLTNPVPVLIPNSATQTPESPSRPQIKKPIAKPAKKQKHHKASTRRKHKGHKR
jgi:hypothetical protein